MNNKGFHVSVKPISKKKGHSIISKIAYNSGEKLVDKSTGEVHDYTSKQKEKTLLLKDKDGNVTAKKVDKNLAHSAIILPENCQNISVNREQFWNEINAIETRKNAQVGTELVMMFPEGLDEKGRINLANKMGQVLADRYNTLVDYSIHRPHSHEQKSKTGEVVERTTDNHHLHMILAPREIIQSNDSYLLSNRKTWNLWSTEERLIKGLNGRGDELKFQRKTWANLANEMLPEKKHISEKSYRERGVQQLPTRKLGKTLYRDVLKGKSNIFEEYNELIKDINKYIKDNDLELDYNDGGRIDEEVNEQEITYKNDTYKVGYKKRKPFKNPDLTKIKVLSLSKELVNETNLEDFDNILSSFMSLGEQIGNEKKLERTALFTQLDGLSEQLSKQSQRYLKRQKFVARVSENKSDLGKDFRQEIEYQSSILNDIKVFDDIDKIKKSIKKIDGFTQDETRQTSEQVQHIKDAIKSITANVNSNADLFKNSVEDYNKFLNKFVELEKLDKEHKKTVDKLDQKLIKVEVTQQHKDELLEDWRQAFNDLRSIEVTNNLDTYNKFSEYAKFDENKLDELVEKSKEIARIKPIDIDAKTKKQIEDFTSELDDFKQINDDDIKKLSAQIKTSIKTYERLEPLYSEREDLLDTSLAVIQQDDELHEEITRTKTTQLNPERLKDWQERTQALHAKLVRQHELAEQAKLEQEQREEQERLARIEQQRQAEKDAYNKRVGNYVKEVVGWLPTFKFNEIKDIKLVEKVERLAISTCVLNAIESLSDELKNDTQKQLNNKQLLAMKEQVRDDKKELYNEIDKLHDNSSKAKSLEQLNDKLKQLLEVEHDNSNLLEVSEHIEQKLEQTKEHIQQQSRSYSPRPF